MIYNSNNKYNHKILTVYQYYNKYLKDKITFKSKIEIIEHDITRKDIEDFINYYK